MNSIQPPSLHPRLDRRGIASFCLIAAMFASAARAGDLNPPAGPVQETGKTLREIEPRTALSADNTPGGSGALYIITTSGSYYLTGNISAGGRYAIEVAPSAGDVTIDLNGFTITLVPSVTPVHTATGIFANDSPNRTLTVRNGVIRAQITFTNVALAVEGGANTVIEDVRVHGTARGMVAPDHSTIRRCDVSQVLSNVDDAAGIQAGLYSTVEGCRVRGVNTTGTTAHIRVGAHSIVRDCQILSTEPCEIGIDAGSGSMVERNLIRNDDSVLAFTAISCPSGAMTARGNTVSSLNTGTSTGISCGGASTIQDNVFSGLDLGINIGVAADCLITRNHFRGGTTINSNFPASNIIGPIVNAGGAAASDNPHANYSN